MKGIINILRAFKKYLSLVGLFLILLSLDWFFNVINPRKGEDIIVSIRGTSVSDLLMIKVFRVNLNSELVEIAVNEIHNYGEVKWKVSDTFAKQIVINVPQNVPQFDSVNISIGEKYFRLNQMQLISENISLRNSTSTTRFIVPDFVKNSALTFPVLRNILNLPVNKNNGILIFFIKGMGLLFIFYFISVLISKIIPLVNFKFNSFNNSIRTIVIIGGSVLLTFIVGYTAFFLAQIYNNNYPYFLDPVGNQLRFASIFEQLKHSSGFTVILDQLKTNEINPFRGILAILFATSLLKTPFGHMLNTLLFMLLFFILSICALYKSSNNIVLSFTLVLLFAAAPILINPQVGIGQFWQDLSAGFPLALAGICFYNWYLFRRMVMIVLFSLFLSFAILSRFNILFYAIFIFGPLFLIIFFESLRNKRTLFKSLIVPLGISIMILGVFCGYWIIEHLDYNLNYYNQSDSFGNTGFSPFKSLIGLLSRLLVDFRIEYLLLFIMVFVFSLWNQKTHSHGKLILVWFIFSFVIFWILILGLDSMKLGKVYFVGFPMIFFSLAQILIKGRINSPKFNYLIILIGCFSCMIMFLNFKDFYYVSEKPSYNRIKDKKRIQLLIAEVVDTLDKKNKEIYFNNFLDNEQENLGIKLETFYKTTKMIKITHDYFSSDSAFYIQRFPGSDLKEISTVLLREINDSLNLAVMFSDTTLTNYYFDNKYSSYISKQVTDYVKSDPDWKEIKTISTNTYSDISIFSKR